MKRIAISRRIYPELVDALRQEFDVVANQEDTSLGADGLAQMLAGADAALLTAGERVDDALLARIGRRHTAREALAAYDLLRAAGFGNLGFDLIRGLPGQSPGIWRNDLARAIALAPEHLSLYGLGIEEGTELHREQVAGRLALPTEDEEAAMLAATEELTSGGGYEHYEISNYARPGFRCRHNLDCWALAEYRGFGLAAHSFLRHPAPVRLANSADLDEYVRLAGAGRSAVARREATAPRRLAGETLMLALRTADGIDEAAFAAAHGAPWETLFAEAAALGAARGWIGRANGRARLTGEGMLFSDAVFRLLF
jgi:oxygen-independent coproporphyrinogen-3 oxidase